MNNVKGTDPAISSMDSLCDRRRYYLANDDLRKHGQRNNDNRVSIVPRISNSNLQWHQKELREAMGEGWRSGSTTQDYRNPQIQTDQDRRHLQSPLQLVPLRPISPNGRGAYVRSAGMHNWHLGKFSVCTTHLTHNRGCDSRLYFCAGFLDYKTCR